MLQYMRNRASGIIAKTLFVLLAASFGVWGIDSSFFSGDAGQVIATVEDREITVSELANAAAAQRRVLGQAFDDRQMRRLGLMDTLLDQLIDTVAVDLVAEDLGLDVSDAQLAQAIRNDRQFQDSFGLFNRQVFRNFLLQQNLSEAAYMQALRHDLRTNLLLNATLAGVEAPAPLVNSLAGYRHEQRRAILLPIPIKRFTQTLDEPDEAMLREIYTTQQAQFMAPEYREIDYVYVSIASVSEKITVPEADLQTHYEQRIDNFTRQEHRNIQQIIGSQEKLTKIRAAIIQGNNIEKAAEAENLSVIDLGLVTENDLIEEMAAPAFSLRKDEISQLVQSPYGWHLFQVSTIEPEKVQSFAEVRDELYTIIQNEQATDQMVDLSIQLDDLLAAGATLAEASSKLDLAIQNIPAIDKQGKRPDGRGFDNLPPTPFLQEIFQLDQGEQSLLYDVPDEGAFVFQIKTITPSAIRSFASVTDKLITLWKQQEGNKHAQTFSEALLLSAKAGKTLEELSVEQKLSLENPEPFKRDHRDESVGLSAAMVTKLFNARLDEIVSAPSETGPILAKLTETIPAAFNEEDTETKAIRDSVKRELSRDLVDQLRMAARTTYRIKRNQAAFEQAFPQEN